MDISNSVLSASSAFQSRDPEEIGPTLSINLSRNEQIDRKIAQIQRDRIGITEETYLETASMPSQQ